MRTLISLTFSLSMLASFFTNLADRIFTGPAEKTEVISNSTMHASLAMMLHDTVSINDANIIEGNDTTMIDTLLFVVERTNINSAFTLGYTSMDSTANGGYLTDRIGDTDFIPIGGSLQFQSNGALTDTIKVPVLADMRTELDEYLKVRLTGVSNTTDTIFIKDNIGVGTIINNDTSYLYAQDVTIIEGATNPDSLCFVVSMEGELDTNFLFNFTTTDGTATVSGNDYYSNSGLGTGSGTGVGTTFLGLDTIKIGIQDDILVELDETLNLLLSNIDAFGRSLLFQNNDSLSIGTIIDNDTAYVSINDASLVEGNTGIDSMDFVITTSHLVDSLGIVFNIVDSTAVAGEDYVQKMDTVFLNGINSTTIRVAVNGDALVELEEYLKVVLTGIIPGNRAVSFADSIGVGTISNDDKAQLTIDDVSMDEGNSGGVTVYNFTVTLNNDVDNGLTVDFETCDSIATIADTDYVANSGTLNFTGTASETQMISVNVVGDGIVEVDELFATKLSNIQAGGRNIIFADSIGIGYIQNDDFDPSIADPCSCLANETTSGAKDGQFSETVSVTSQPGETWYISSVSGLYASPIGAFPPASGGASYPLTSFSTGAAGQKLTEIDLGNGLSQYILNGIHVDDIGYSIVLTNGTDTLTIGNLCHYEKACSADQTFTMPFSGVNGMATVDNCTGNNLFVNDGIHSYRDGEARYNEMTICPNIAGQILSASFQTFDLASGDTLAVYDGMDATAPFIAKGSGNSISQINGGSVKSNCDPNINASGCLTFVFTTNGDNFKGGGWEAIVNCSLQGITLLNRPDDVFASASCDSLKTRVNFRTPTISRSSSDCLLSNDDIIVSYCDFRDTLPANQLSYPVFPIGVYEVTYKLLADTTITVFNRVHVSAPVLACNDTIVTSIGQGCSTMLLPDDILEDACDEASGSTSQTYSIRIKTDTGYVVGTGPNYPVLNAGKGGNVTCNTFYDVSIFRTLQVNVNGCMKSTIDSCSSVVKLIDGIKPIFVTVPDTTVFGCQGMSLTQSMLPTPTVIDNCEIDRLVATIPNDFGGNCDANKIIEVTWTAYDLCGNSSTAVQNVTLERPEKLLAPRDTIISCNANTDPELTGWPSINASNGTDNLIITTEMPICNFELTFEDKMIPGTCGSNANILRIFTLFNDCDNSGDLISVDTQYILLRDTIAPVVSCPTANALGSSTNPYTFKTAYNDCAGLPGTIPLPSGMDNCDSQLSAVVQGVFRVSDGTKVASQLIFLNPLEIGLYRVDFVLRDDCGNDSEVCNVYFGIVDETIPTAICSDELIVSLAYGDLTITAEDISRGSFDACGIDTVLIRRTLCGSSTEYPETINDFVASKFGTELGANGWSSAIEIGCCDINSSIKVQLLVIDNNGNHNKCWLTISTESQLQSVCGNLPDASGYCDDFEVNYLGESTDANENRAFDESEWQPIEESLLTTINNQFGNPACDVENTTCVNAGIEQEYQLLKESCGVQVMKRRFRIKADDNDSQVWYYQNITVDYRPGWSITFPADTTLQCGTTDVGNIPEMLLAINRGTCDQIGWEVKDKVYETEDGSCFKVLREWLVINGCQHSDVQNPFELPRDQFAGIVTPNSKRTFASSESVQGTALATKGYFTYTQVIIVMDSEAPIITIADVDTCIVGVPDVEPYGEADVTPGAAPYECDTLRLFSATGMDCTASDDLDFNYEIFEGNVRLSSGEGSEFSYVVQSNKTYNVRFTASDNCGNIAAQEKSFTFKDCQRPIAICQSAQLNLNSNGAVSVTTSDVNLYSYDNCTTTSDLDLRIWHAALGTTAPTNLAEVLALPTSISLDCSHFGQTIANLYVIDEAQLYSFCSATINITDNAELCKDARPTIAGRIQTTAGEMVEEVEVLLEGTGEMPEMITTDNSGSFSYQVEYGADYTIRPKKDNYPLNGVSTFDLVLVQKHILGLKPFDSPYSYIAADVNQSGSVTAFDMVITRQLILNIIPDFPNNESWKFVNMAYPMSAANPLIDGYQQEHIVTAIDKTITLDFMAVKVGDVNGSARATELLASEKRSFKGILAFKVKDQTVKAGQSYSVDFRLANPNKVEGYQFTLGYDGLGFESWEDGLAQENNFGYTLAKRGLLTTSWNRNGNTKFSEETSFFTLKFVAQKDGLLSEMLMINSTITESEGYSTEGELLAVDLIFDELEDNDKPFDLYQNRPNPFGDNTEISFYLSEASPTTFTIMDMAGKVLKTMKADYAKGTHTITLERGDLPASGLLFYQLESSAGKMTKTMLVID